MEHLPLESVSNVYDTYLTAEQIRLIVLNGLKISDPITTLPLQAFIIDQITYFTAAYWVLLTASLLYVIGLNIAIPLLKRHNLY